MRFKAAWSSRVAQPSGFDAVVSGETIIHPIRDGQAQQQPGLVNPTGTAMKLELPVMRHRLLYQVPGSRFS